MSIRFALGLCAFVSVAACAAGQPRLDVIAEGYVRAALQLSQHDPSLVEQWRGPESWAPGPRRPVAELQHDIDELRRHVEVASADISSAAESARVAYLSGQIRALRYAAERQLGRSASIDDQARDEFGVTFSTPDRKDVAGVHQQLAHLLPGDRPLAARVLALRRATTIPRERRVAVLTRALAACRDATPLPTALPLHERVELTFKSGIAWDAFARYHGQHHTEIEINEDGELDVTRALRLACHEGYPGHHVQHVLIDRAFAEHQWPELLLTPGFGPHLLFTEGAAEVAADLALPAPAREQLYRASLFPSAGLDPAHIPGLVRVEDLLQDLLPVVTDVARQYLASQISEAHAIDRLTNEALVANPRGVLAFVEQRRARALVYGEGRRIVYASMQSRDLPALFDAFRRVAAVKWTP